MRHYYYIADVDVSNNGVGFTFVYRVPEGKNLLCSLKDHVSFIDPDGNVYGVMSQYVVPAESWKDATIIAERKNNKRYRDGKLFVFRGFNNALDCLEHRNLTVNV